jgi:hypothetical protein
LKPGCGRPRKDFRDPEKLPRIFIVTEKLLTGFDLREAYEPGGSVGRTFQRKTEALPPWYNAEALGQKR